MLRHSGNTLFMANLTLWQAAIALPCAGTLHKLFVWWLASIAKSLETSCLFKMKKQNMWTIESEQKWNYYSYQYLIFFYKYIHCVLYCTVSNDHYLFCFFNFCEFFFFFCRTVPGNISLWKWVSVLLNPFMKQDKNCQKKACNYDLYITLNSSYIFCNAKTNHLHLVSV